MADSIEKLLEYAKSLKDNYIDEIPKEEVHGELRYKCQKNWFYLITLKMDFLIDNGYIEDKDLISKYITFEKYLSSTNLGKRLTNKEDITKGNEMLDYIMGYAQKKKEAAK